LEESANSLNIQQRSETRQNRNLKTGSASSERPFSGKLSTQLSTADVIEAGETLDDFEEQERQIQKELETSQDERYYSSSVQNRQDDFITDQDIPMDEEYDSDYPDGKFKISLKVTKFQNLKIRDSKERFLSDFF
jgi:hypothetical protein